MSFLRRLFRKKYNITDEPVEHFVPQSFIGNKKSIIDYITNCLDVHEEADILMFSYHSINNTTVAIGLSYNFVNHYDKCSLDHYGVIDKEYYYDRRFLAIKDNKMVLGFDGIYAKRCFVVIELETNESDEAIFKEVTDSYNKLVNTKIS